jgi:SAM-dependent methyltransferase
VSELAPEAAYWDGRYRRNGRLWGDGPSELARLTVARLKAEPVLPGTGPLLKVLDVGCGYGRDAVCLAAELEARVLGVDPSPVAVDAALEFAGDEPDLEFAVAGPEDLVAAHAASFDVVVASNVYHLLPPAVRRRFAAAVVALPRPGGRFFLSTLSPRDPQHYGVGEPVPGEEDSWFEHCYLHFCREGELRSEFGALKIVNLEERKYEERHADGRVHQHVSWFLEAGRPEE